MGNTILNACSGSRYTFTRGTGLLDCCYGRTPEWLFLSSMTIARLGLWAANVALAFSLATMLVISSIAGQYVGIFWYGLFLSVLWGIWWLAADLFFYMAFFIFPWANFTIIAINFTVTLTAQLIIIFQRLWNNSVPVLGLLVSVVFGGLISFLIEMYTTVGEPKIMFLYNMFLARINLMAKIFTNLANTVLTAAPAVLNTLSDIIGPIVKVCFTVIKQMYSFMVFLFRKLIPGLQNLFKVLIWAVKKVKDLFGAGAAASYASRMLFSADVEQADLRGNPSHPRLSRASRTDDLHASFVQEIAHEANLLFTFEGLQSAYSDTVMLSKHGRQHAGVGFHMEYELTHPHWLGQSEEGDDDDDTAARLHQQSRNLLEEFEPEEQAGEKLSEDDGSDTITVSDTVVALEEEFDEDDMSPVPSVKETRQADGTVKEVRRLHQQPLGTAPKSFSSPRAQRVSEFSTRDERTPMYDFEHAHFHAKRHERFAKRLENSANHRALERDAKHVKHTPIFLPHPGREEPEPEHNAWCGPEDKLCQPHKHLHPFAKIARSGTHDYVPQGTHDEWIEGSEDHRSHIIAAATFKHGVTSALRWFETHEHAVQSRRMIGHHLRSALKRATVHRSTGDFLHMVHTRYAHPFDFVLDHIHKLHDHELFQWMLSRDVNGHKHWFNWVKNNPIGRQTRQHPTSGHAYSTYDYYENSDFFRAGVSAAPSKNLDPLMFGRSGPQALRLPGRSLLQNGGGRPLESRLPFFQLLSTANCYDTDPANPMCIPDFIPADFKLQIGLLRTPTIFLALNDACGLYFYQPSRRVPHGFLQGIKPYVMWLVGNAFVGPMRFVNGVIYILIVVAWMFKPLAFSVEFLGLRWPVLKWISKGLLILSPGSNINATTLSCLVVHVYDPFVLFLYVVLLGFAVKPYYDVVRDAVRSLLSTRSKSISNMEAARERQQRVIESGLRSRMQDTEANPGNAEHGDRNYNNRDAMGRHVPGESLNPLATKGPLAFKSHTEVYGREETWRRPDGSLTPMERRERSLPWVIPPGGGDPVSRYPGGAAGVISPSEDFPVDAQMGYSAAAAANPQDIDLDISDVRPLLTVSTGRGPAQLVASPYRGPVEMFPAPSVLPPTSQRTLSRQTLTDLSKKIMLAMAIWGPVQTEMSQVDFERWSNAYSWWLRPINATAEWQKRIRDDPFAEDALLDLFESTQ